VRASDLPAGAAPPPVPLPHFPDLLHAFVWRNWSLVPVERLARVTGAASPDIAEIGRSMGLGEPPQIGSEQWRRSHLTVIRRNWHLLPYEQLLDLLGWTPEELAYALQEDDFLFHKLGRLKPACAPLRYAPPDERCRRRAAEIAGIVREQFGEDPGRASEPLFAFVEQLSASPPHPDTHTPTRVNTALSPRFCYSYFALYGDPLLDTDCEPYPDGYLARLAASGVDGVWLQGVLYRLALFPWQPELSARFEERLENLRALVERAARHGIGIYLYLNEPRSMPLSFFEAHPELRGVTAGDYAALCTSVPEVRAYLSEAVASICRAVPDLAGYFTITASENLTNCWSHHRGGECPRCGQRSAAGVVAEVNALVQDGIRASGSAAQLIAYDWGWKEEWAPEAIGLLPAEAALMCVSEWSLPIAPGGVESIVGEYSISAVGPGPRALRHWRVARERGLKTIAKIQANNTWEISAVPYIPAVENVARHAANLRDAGVDGLMLGWTLGGYPSPNLEVVAEIGSNPGVTPDRAMERVARRRFGDAAAPAMSQAWKEWSRAFSAFPFHIGTVYTAPLQVGPANLLWEAPTGYKATMIGFPYDDLETWRAVYPAEVFEPLLRTIADRFEAVRTEALEALRREGSSGTPPGVRDELSLAATAAIHFRSVANQVRFVLARRSLESAEGPDAEAAYGILERVLREELDLALQLHEIQTRDSRIGFEASNQYYYVPLDLAEKVLNCRDLLDRWLPRQRAGRENRT
jgi:hypothetical protein